MNGASSYRGRKGLLKRIGVRLITGAADDDPCAIGTYASVGAKLGIAFLWLAPLAFPLMFVAVYLSSKLGRATGEGLFALIRARYPRWVLWVVLVPSVLGNTAVVAADLGAMAAVVDMFLPLPSGAVGAVIGFALLALQIFGSYRLIRRIFRWLSLSLLAYVAAALMAKPELGAVLRGTFVPTFALDGETLTLLVAVLGTALSAYLYTWQVSQEVEEQREKRLRAGPPRVSRPPDLRTLRNDVALGMLFASVVMYFVILATGSTLHVVGRTEIGSASDAAEALRPVAGGAAQALFAAGVFGVGALAVPVVSTAAAFALCQATGLPNGLKLRPLEAKAFYSTIAGVTVVALALNFIGLNPMRSLVWASVVQAFAAPPLLFLVWRMTNDRGLMKAHVNGRAMRALGLSTLVISSSSTVALIVSWFS